MFFTCDCTNVVILKNSHGWSPFNRAFFYATFLQRCILLFTKKEVIVAWGKIKHKSCQISPAYTAPYLCLGVILFEKNYF